MPGKSFLVGAVAAPGAAITMLLIKFYRVSEGVPVIGTSSGVTVAGTVWEPRLGCSGGDGAVRRRP